MKISEVSSLTESIARAFQALLPQLNPIISIPDRNELEEIICSPNSVIFIAEEGEIVGTLTLVIYKTPSGSKAWIEDVIVDSASRGKGIGEKLIRFAIDYVRQKGISRLDLTSSPHRTQANNLYLKLGFIKRETNVYRLEVETM